MILIKFNAITTLFQIIAVKTHKCCGLLYNSSLLALKCSV